MVTTYAQLIFRKICQHHPPNLETHYALCLLLAVESSATLAVEHFHELLNEQCRVQSNGFHTLCAESCTMAREFLQRAHSSPPTPKNYRRSLVLSLVENGYPTPARLLLKEEDLDLPISEFEFGHLYVL